MLCHLSSSPSVLRNLCAGSAGRGTPHIPGAAALSESTLSKTEADLVRNAVRAQEKDEECKVLAAKIRALDPAATCNLKNKGGLERQLQELKAALKRGPKAVKVGVR